MTTAHRLGVALLLTLALPAAAANLGLYFDQTTWNTEIETDLSTEVWLVLREVDTADVVAGWECSVETTTEGDAPLMVWDLLGTNPYNYATPPQFIVGLQVPFPATSDIALAHAIIFPSGYQTIDLRVQPYLNPSVMDDNGFVVWRPVIARMVWGVLLQPVEPAGGGSWLPEARLNPAGPVALPALAVDGDLAFGSVPPGGDAVQSLTLRNETEAAIYGRLNIDGADFSVRLDDDPWTADGRWVALPPSTDVSVEVRFAPDVTGSSYGSLTLWDGGDLLVRPLSGGGNAEPPATLEPAWLDFGVVPPGNEAVRLVTLQNTSDAAIQVVPGTPTPPFQVLNDPQPQDLAPGESLTLSLMMPADVAGLHSLELPLGDGLPPVLGLGYAPVDAGCTVAVDDPDAGDFDTVVIGYPETRVITYRNDGQWDFSGEITLAGDVAVFDIVSGGGPMTLPPGAVHTVEVRCNPSAEGTWEAVLSGPQICQDVPLACQSVWPVSTCIVTPDAVDFGTLIIGQSASQPVRIRNTGNVTLSGEPSIIGDAAFSLPTPAPYTLAPGDSIQIMVLFTPVALGEVAASLDLGQDACGPVPLVGVGREAQTGCAVIELLDFGSHWVGYETIATLEVHNSGELQLVLDPQITGEAFSVIEPTDLIIDPGQTGEVTVRLRPEAPGLLDELLDLGNPECPPVTLLANILSGDTGGMCVFLPANLSFSATPVLETSVLEVAVLNGTVGSFTTTAAVLDSPHFTPLNDTPFTVPAQEARWIAVVFQPQSPGFQQGHLLLPDSPCSQLPLSGQGISNGCDVDPLVRDFPTLVFGILVTATVEVTNSGNDQLVLAPVCDDPVFTVTPTAAALAPGESLDVVIDFTAPAPGHYEAVLSLGSAMCVDVALVADALDETDLCVVSPEVWQVQNAFVDAPQTTIIYVQNNGTEILSLLPLISPPMSFFSVTDAPDEVDPGTTGQVELQFLATQTGSFTAVLSLGPEVCQDVELTALVVDLPPGDCLVSPSSVSLFEIPMGMSIIRDVSIQNTGDTSLVVNLQDQDGFVRFVEGGGVHWIAPGNNHGCRARFFAPTQGEFTYAVELNPGACSIQVTGYGTSPAYPCELDPYIIDFGQVLVGQSRFERFTLRNIGDETQYLDIAEQVGPFEVSGAGPRTVGLLHVISPGVRFEPSSAGQYFLPIDMGVYGCGPALARGSAVNSASGIVAVHPALDFGALDAGATGSLTLQVVNLGEEPAVFQPTVTGTGYVLTTPTSAQTLAPGQEIVLELTSTPTTPGSSQGRLSLGLADHPEIALKSRVIDPAATSPRLEVQWTAEGTTADDGTFRLPAGVHAVTGRLVVSGLTPGDQLVGWRAAVRCIGGDFLAWQPAGETASVTLAGGVPLTILPEEPLLVDTEGRLELATFSVALHDDGPAAVRVDGGAEADWPQLRFDHSEIGLAVVTAADDHVAGRVVTEPTPDTPSVTRLGPVYPNPFNPSTKIPLELAQNGRARMDVYDVTGRRVAIILDEVRPAGRYLEQWGGQDTDGRPVASGAYYVRLEAGGVVHIQKMTMLK